MGLFACLGLESKLMMISLPYCGVCSSSAMTNVPKHRSKDEGGVVSNMVPVPGAEQWSGWRPVAALSTDGRAARKPQHSARAR